MSWKDREYVRKDENQTYPFIQWVNDGGSLEPRNAVGGFAMPTDQAAILGTNIPGDLRLLHHRGGGSTEVIFTIALEAAVLSTRFCWIKDGQAVPAYEPGARGKVQALALVRDANGNAAGPVILTFRGHAGKNFSAALKDHRQAVRKATGGKAPAYAFVGLYQAGEIQMVGKAQQSPVTTTVLAADGFDPDAAYIGDAALDGLDWDAVDTWKAAWDQPGANGNGDGGEEDTPTPKPKAGDEKPKPKNPNAPASDAQWGLIRKLMAEIGIEGRDKQDEMIARAGYDPKALTMGQASELIDRLQKAAKKNGNGSR